MLFIEPAFATASFIRFPTAIKCVSDFWWNWKPVSYRKREKIVGLVPKFAEICLFREFRYKMKIWDRICYWLVSECDFGSGFVCKSQMSRWRTSLRFNWSRCDQRRTFLIGLEFQFFMDDSQSSRWTIGDSFKLIPTCEIGVKIFMTRNTSEGALSF